MSVANAKWEELYKGLNALKERLEAKDKEGARKAAEDVAKNAPKGRLTEFPVNNVEATDLTVIHKSRSRDSKVIEFQKRADDVYLVSKILGIDPRQTKLYQELQEPVSELRKAMTTAAAGAGAEWIPTGFSADLIQMIELQLRVAALHPRIDMPTDPFKVPRKTAATIAKLATEGQAPTGQTVGTGQVTLDAKTLIAYVPVTYQLQEDSIVPLLPTIKDDIATALARAIETATINGDDSATHQDADVTGADDARKAWKGYRKLAVAAAKVDAANAALTRDLLRTLRKKLGKYGVDPNSLAWVVGISGYNQMLNLSETITVDKYGPNATILTGELGKFDGIPVIVSEYVREDLNATGVYDGTTTNRTIVLLVRKDAFVYGDRREVLVETDRDIKAQTVDLVASQRAAFVDRIAATEPIVGVLYNVAV